MSTSWHRRRALVRRKSCRCDQNFTMGDGEVVADWAVAGDQVKNGNRAGENENEAWYSYEEIVRGSIEIEERGIEEDQALMKWFKPLVKEYGLQNGTLLVKNVSRLSPAGIAGIKKGDRLLTVDGFSAVAMLPNEVPGQMFQFLRMKEGTKREGTHVVTIKLLSSTMTIGATFEPSLGIALGWISDSILRGAVNTVKMSTEDLVHFLCLKRRYRELLPLVSQACGIPMSLELAPVGCCGIRGEIPGFENANKDFAAIMPFYSLCLVETNHLELGWKVADFFLENFAHVFSDLHKSLCHVTSVKAIVLTNNTLTNNNFERIKRAWGTGIDLVQVVAESVVEKFAKDRLTELLNAKIPPYALVGRAYLPNYTGLTPIAVSSTFDCVGNDGKVSLETELESMLPDQVLMLVWMKYDRANERYDYIMGRINRVAQEFAPRFIKGIHVITEAWSLRFKNESIWLQQERQALKAGLPLAILHMGSGMYDDLVHRLFLSAGCTEEDSRRGFIDIPAVTWVNRDGLVVSLRGLRGIRQMISEVAAHARRYSKDALVDMFSSDGDDGAGSENGSEFDVHSFASDDVAPVYVRGTHLSLSGPLSPLDGDDYDNGDEVEEEQSSYLGEDL